MRCEHHIQNSSMHVLHRLVTQCETQKFKLKFIHSLKNNNRRRPPARLFNFIIIRQITKIKVYFNFSSTYPLIHCINLTFVKKKTIFFSLSLCALAIVSHFYQTFFLDFKFGFLCNNKMKI